MSSGLGGADHEGPVTCRHGDDDDVTADQLAPPAALRLAVDAHLALVEKVAGRSPRVGHTGQLQQLPEPDPTAVHLDRFHEQSLAAEQGRCGTGPRT